jgi:hypothetical protein
MDRGKAADAKRGELNPAIAKVGSWKNIGQAAAKDAELSGRDQDRRISDCVKNWPLTRN